MKSGVVVGYDQSPSSDRALAEAGREAAWRDVGITVVNAFQWVAVTHPAAVIPRDLETSLKEAGDTIAAAGADWLRRQHPGMAVTSAAAAGPTAEMVARAARNAELLVLGNRGRGGFAGLLLSSVSMRALTMASCPTMIVRGGAGEPADSVVLALDVEDPADEVIEFAFAEASHRKALLRATYVWGPERTGTAGSGNGVCFHIAPDQVVASLRTLVETLLKRWQSGYPDVRLAIEIADGSPSAALTAATATADLVVTGAHRRGDGRLGMRPGPIVHTLLHHADCAVAVVPRR